jgi:hypothetical protein
MHPHTDPEFCPICCTTAHQRFYDTRTSIWQEMAARFRP